MKVNAELFIERLDKVELINEIIFIGGNEPGFVSHIENQIVKNIKKTIDSEILDINFKENNIKNFDELTNSQSLFSKHRIIKLTNPKDVIVSNIDSLDPQGFSILINGESLSPSSKIRKFFDGHKKYFSIYCYELSKQFKKKFIESIIKENNIVFTDEAYWYFLEKSDDTYRGLEDNIEKILLLKQSKIDIGVLKKILINSKNVQMDELFFLCFVANQAPIIVKSESTIQSSSDAYRLLQVVKNFNKILIQTSEQKNEGNINSLVNSYLPRYLFKYKKNFESAIIKTNMTKIVSINKLIERAELLLRKNESLFLIASQRFLLNCNRILK